MSEKCLRGNNRRCADVLVEPMARRVKAFTLVELLVVIGIIAILISIILPSLSAARKSANQVKCAAALKEIGNAFKLYSIDFENAYPVEKWDIPVASQKDYPELNPAVSPSSAGYFLYWQDFLAKYVTRTATEMGMGSMAARHGIFWGCPAWQGRYGGYTAPDGTSAYENGYAMNCCPTWQPTTPNPWPPLKEWAVDSAQQGISGRWPRLTQYNAERCLVMEANLWLPFTVGTDATHTVAPELNCSNPGFSGHAGPNGSGTPPGYNSIDRYRHGTYPSFEADGISFNPSGGKVKYNMLFGDGHVSELNSINDGVQAIQMRAP